MTKRFEDVTLGPWKGTLAGPLSHVLGIAKLCELQGLAAGLRPY
jgi:hypothetical protein